MRPKKTLTIGASDVHEYAKSRLDKWTGIERTMSESHDRVPSEVESQPESRLIEITTPNTE